MQAQQCHSRLESYFERLQNTARVEKTHFSCQLKKDFEAFFKCVRSYFCSEI